MCQEIYHMMRTMNQDGLEFQLALQCAPLITGIKISNCSYRNPVRVVRVLN